MVAVRGNARCTESAFREPSPCVQCSGQIPRSRLCFQFQVLVLSRIVSALKNRRAWRPAAGPPGKETADVSLVAQGAVPGSFPDKIQRAGQDSKADAQDWLSS